MYGNCSPCVTADIILLCHKASTVCCEVQQMPSPLSQSRHLFCCVTTSADIVCCVAACPTMPAVTQD